jgi:hypothetical protein
MTGHGRQTRKLIRAGETAGSNPGQGIAVGVILLCCPAETSSGAISHVDMELIQHFGGTVFDAIITSTLRAEIISEILDYNYPLTGPIARQDLVH